MSGAGGETHRSRERPVRDADKCSKGKCHLCFSDSSEVNCGRLCTGRRSAWAGLLSRAGEAGGSVMCSPISLKQIGSSFRERWSQRDMTHRLAPSNASLSPASVPRLRLRRLPGYPLPHWQLLRVHSDAGIQPKAAISSRVRRISWVSTTTRSEASSSL
jgi:hypothetical protein